MEKPNALTKQEHGTTQPGRKGGSEMATVRRLVGGILVALIVIVGHASARTMSDYDYVHQYLAVSQGTWIDTDGDGYGNSLGFDVNRDGHWDAFRFSDLASGNLSVAVLVYGSNTALGVFKDSTGSGRFGLAFDWGTSELHYALADENGHYTVWVTIPSPEVRGQPQPSDGGVGPIMIIGGRRTP